jgi:hypothetical protein
MANFTKNYETTEIVGNPNVLGGGARPLDTYDLDLGLGESKPYTKTPFDFTKINIKDYIGDTSQTKVLCKDGTFGYDLSSSNAKYDNSKTCMNNGGRAENQTVVNSQKEVAYSSENLSPEEKFYQSLGIKSKGGWSFTVKAKGRLLVAVVLVGGYFAYKKFKK